MGARAEATAATGTRILDAAEAIFDEGPRGEFTLARVAERSGVTVQTVLRRFGDREGLIVATLIHVAMKMGKERTMPDSDDAGEAVDDLLAHYEKYGDRILRALAEEDRNPALRKMTDFGRNYHREWCEQVFAPALKGLRDARRDRRIAQFVAITDIYVWKLLRHDRQLSSRQTKLAMRELLAPLMERES
jgi:AcrR family transcriptional regulator